MKPLHLSNCRSTLKIQTLPVHYPTYYLKLLIIAGIHASDSFWSLGPHLGQNALSVNAHLHP
jgi:hypothetical protein